MNSLTQREEIDSLSKPFAFRLTAMIESGLLTYEHYYPWTDSIIQKLDSPPLWILELSCVKSPSDAVKVIGGYIYSEPFEALSWDEWTDDCIASLFLCYEKQKISWLDFLQESENRADNNGGRIDCGVFYELRNTYKDSAFSKKLEKQQSAELASDHRDILDSVSRTFNAIRIYSNK